MADWLMDMLWQTAEYRGWDSWSVRIGTVGTAVFAVLEVWALWGQCRKVKVERSGKSISIEWLTASMFVFWAFFLYGLFTNSAVSALNGLFTGLMHIPLVWALHRYEGFTRRQWWVFWGMALSIPLMIVVPDPQMAFGIVSVVLVASVAMQPLTLLREQSTGDLTWQMLLTFWASALFWMIYGFAIDDLLLKIVCTSNCVLLSISLSLWLALVRPEGSNAA